MQFNYLLSNNMSYKDRTDMGHLYKAYRRSEGLVSAMSLWMAVETALRVPQIKKMAIGWKLLSIYGVYFGYSQVGNFYASHRY